VLLGSAAFDASGKEANSPRVNAGSQTRMVGAFTGEYVKGAPVYRLPPVIVVASRDPARR
jgi:hypothetical protein